MFMKHTGTDTHRYAHYYIVTMNRTNLNLLSRSARSDDRHVRSTENFSRLTLKIRQWMVLPIYTHKHTSYMIKWSLYSYYYCVSMTK